MAIQIRDQQVFNAIRAAVQKQHMAGALEMSEPDRAHIMRLLLSGPAPRREALLWNSSPCKSAINAVVFDDAGEKGFRVILRESDPGYIVAQ